MLIDTDKARKELEGAGFTGVQVDAQLNVVRMIAAQAQAQLATKDDLALLEQRLTANLKEEMANLKGEARRVARTWAGIAIAVIGLLQAGTIFMLAQLLDAM